MKNTSRKPYIYKVTNLETGQYYIGSQCSGKTIGKDYFTSSTNKVFKEGLETYGEEKYEIIIIKEFEEFVDPKECVRVENYIIRNYMQKRDGLCVNRFYCCSGKKVFSTVGTHHTEEHKKKLSAALKGIPRSEDTRKKMSVAHKGTHFSEEHKKKLSAVHNGLHHSEEVKQKMSEVHNGLHHSEEAKQKMSEVHKIKISIEGEVFDSLTEASKYYNVVVSTINYWLKNKKHNAVYIEK